MCRIAAFRGQELSLGEFLTAPDHSLFRQSWAAREMREAVVNADGFGVGWMDATGKPCRYRSVAPVWSDANVESLSRSLFSSTWLGNVRSSTDGQDLGIANTQPYAANGLLYVHNGYVKDFAAGPRRVLRSLLSEDSEALLRGTTDSEYLFALLLQYIEEGDSVPSALRRLCDTIRKQLPDTECLLSIIVASGSSLSVLRTAFHGRSPSLYLHPDWHGGVAVASECLDDDPAWAAIEEHQLMSIGDEVTTEAL